MGAFRKFIEAQRIQMQAAGKVASGLGSRYKPGTFGVEIEYRVDFGHEIDFDKARLAFRREVDQPMDPKDWVDDNPEPEMPNREDYHFNPKDPFGNYYNIDMEVTPMDKPLPDSLKRIGWNQAIQFDDPILRKMVGGYLTAFANRLDYLYNGYGDPSQGIKFFNTTKSFYQWHESMKALLKELAPQRIENSVKRTSRHSNFSLTEEQDKVIRNFQHEAWVALEDFVKFHEQRANGIKREDYKRKIVDIFRKDLRDWKDEHDDWLQELEGVKDNWNSWDEDAEFDAWLERNEERFQTSSGDVKGEIKEMDDWFSSQGVNGWDVFEDEEGIVEIASPILTVADLPFLRTLLETLKYKDFDTGTGLHVHIGMPPMTDAFDLLAVSVLTDEESIMAMTHRTQWTVQRYTKKKDALFKEIFDKVPEGVVKASALYQLVRSSISQPGLVRGHTIIDRYFGTNILSAFERHGTVEMRYMTSEIVRQPDKLFKAIQYFLMLPHVARSRNQLRYTIPGTGTIVFSRRPGDNVEVRKFVQGAKPRVRMSSEPVSQLRKELPERSKEERMAKFGMKQPRQGQQPPAPPRQVG